MSQPHRRLLDWMIRQWLFRNDDTFLKEQITKHWIRLAVVHQAQVSRREREVVRDQRFHTNETEQSSFRR